MATNLYSYDIVSATEVIQTAVDHLLSKEKTVPSSLRRELEQWRLSEKGVECEEGVEVDASGNKMIAFETVLRIQKQLAVTPLPGDKVVHLCELLCGSEILFPSFKPPPRNPELVARLEKIRANVEKKEYQKMVASIEPQMKLQATAENLRLDVQATHRQLWMVVNFFLTVIGSFVFGYYAALFSGMSSTGCVLIGFTMAMAVFFADLYFIAKNA